MSPADGRSYPRSPRRTKVVRSNQPTVADLPPNVRTLDPSSALRVAGQQPPQPTVYIGDALLLRQTADGADTIAALRDAAAAHHLVVTVSPAEQRLVELARRLGISEQDAQPLLSRVRLTPDETVQQAAPPPDAWQVLQTFRSAQRADATVASQVHLDHVLSATARIDGVPLTSGHGIDGAPLTSGHGIDGVPLTSGHGVGGSPLTSGHGVPYEAAEYGMPGRGGRSPVAWIGPAPYRRADAAVGGRRPVVAILDTGVGEHPWLGPDVVHRNPTVDGQPIGLTDAATDAESPDVHGNPLIGSLDPDSGHGTFIAGLIRQSCPDADILAVRIMHGDGVVSEGDLIDALNKLWLRQLLAIEQDDPAGLIDVVSLSLGYYHEQPADAAYDPLLLTPLRALSRLGVAVVASSGNDATLRPMYPAAFAPYPGGAVPAPEPGAVPLTAVGALNPGGTVALFSNEGPWVTCKRPGSALVSTIPTGFDAAGQPTYQTHYADEIRETLDPDDFRSGFAVWSGTSFAAPILAGEIAQALLDGPAGSLDRLDQQAAVDRTLAALAAATTPSSTPAAAGTVPAVAGQRQLVSAEGAS